MDKILRGAFFLFFSILSFHKVIAAQTINTSIELTPQRSLESSTDDLEAQNPRHRTLLPSVATLSNDNAQADQNHLDTLENIETFSRSYIPSLIGGKTIKPRPTTAPTSGSSTQRPNRSSSGTTTAEPDSFFPPIGSPIEVDSKGSGLCGKPSVAPSDTPNSRIVNGVAVPNGGQPWACAMVQKSRFQYCGCTVIDRQWVATASHCVDGNTEVSIKANTKIFLGTTNLVTATALKGNIRSIARVIMHPQYDSKTTNNDIALIKLASPIPTFTDTLMPACLPTGPITARAVQTGTKGRRICFTAGWGRLSEKQQSGGKIGAGTDLLQQTAIEMFSTADCKAGLRGLTYTDKMICGGFDGGKYDSCQGDSGGPMVCDSGNGSWTLNGIVSFGIGCARLGYPGVYSNVYIFVPWINQTIAKN